MIKKLLLRLMVLSLLVLLVHSPTWATDYTQDANVVGAWLIDVDEDPVQDASSNNIDLGHGVTSPTFGTSTPDPPAAYSDGYYTFGGSAVILTTNDNDIQLTSDFSYVIWVYPTADDAQSNIMGKRDATGGNYQANFRLLNAPSARNPSLLNSSGSVAASAGIADATWTHLAVTNDDDGNTIHYSNGATNGSATSPANASKAIRWSVGRRENDSGPFPGNLTQVAAFDDVLDSTEINDIKDNGLVPIVVAAGQLIMISKLDQDLQRR